MKTITHHDGNARSRLSSIFKVFQWTAIASFLGLAIFFLVRHLEERSLVRNLVSSIELDHPATIDEQVIATSQVVYEKTNGRKDPEDLSFYERHEAFSPANITTGVSLKHGIYIVEGHDKDGPCGTMSRNLLNALWYQGLDARKFHVEMPDGNGHTMVEYRDVDKWKVIAPSDNSFVWRTSEGDVASAKEIQNDDQLFQQIYSEVPDYGYRFDHPKRFNWDRLPAFAHEQALAWYGQEWCDEFQTPRIFDQPRLALAIACFVGALTLYLGPKLISLVFLWLRSRFGSREAEYVPQRSVLSSD